jgi:renalase
MQDIYDSIIVGAGISGLFLASRLRSENLKLAVVEKSKSVGGRVATRRDGQATYDHGAQFYKIRKEESFPLDQTWSNSGTSQIWFEQGEYAFKAATQGLTKLAKSIANLDEIKFNEKVIRITEGSHLNLECESGNHFACRRVYLTSPLPQTLSILDASQICYPPSLSQIQYASALVGLFEFDSQSIKHLPFSYLENLTPHLYSVSNQQSKSVSQVPAATVVMTPTWSRSHFDSDEAATLSTIQSEFESFLNSVDPKLSSSIMKSQLKKWRFSHPLSKFSEPHIIIGSTRSIFLLGDSFGGASIRGAINSALSIPV